MKSSSRGFSIIEILITLIVLGIGILAVTKFQGTTIKNSSLSAQRAEAINYARQKLESLRDDVAKNITMVSGTSNQAGTTVQNFTITWTITKNPALDNGYDTSVAVTWPDQTGVVSTDTTVGIATVISDSPSALNVASESLPDPSTSDDPTLDLVVCTCSGTSSTSGGFSKMSGSRIRNEFFRKVGMMNHNNWSTTQQTSICDSCCSLTTTSSFSGGMMGGGMGGGSTYICGVRKGTSSMRWAW